MTYQTDETPTTCPECNEVLEEGRALLLSAMVSDAAYLCTRCRLIYTRDLQPLARLVG